MKRRGFLKSLFVGLTGASVGVSIFKPSLKNGAFPARNTFPVRKDITVLPADDPKKLKLGWIVCESIGIGIINTAAISRVTIRS